MSAATTARPAPGRHGLLRRGYLANERLLLGLLGVVGFLALWEFGSANGLIEVRWFSSPTAIFEAGVREVQNPRFWNDVRASVFVLILGYGIAVFTGIPLGLATGWFKKLQWVLDPWLNFFNSLPRIALLPILVIMFGVFGPWSKVAVIFLGAFFAIIIPTVQGVRTVDRRFIDVARSFKASEWLMFRSVVAPATVPFIITGLRLGVARALIGVVTAELYTQSEGLGVMIRRATDLFQSDRALFAILIFTASGIIGVELVRRLENRFSKWRVGEFRR